MESFVKGFWKHILLKQGYTFDKYGKLYVPNVIPIFYGGSLDNKEPQSALFVRKPEYAFNLEYDGKIHLEFKQILKEEDLMEIYLSNPFTDDEEITEKDKCISVLINKKLKLANIHGLSNTKESCFTHPDFILRKPGSFYLDMTIKLFKKYKDKFEINKITLHDNAKIDCKLGGSFNLSQFLLLTKGYTFYEKFGFKIIEKEDRSRVEKSKEVIAKLKIKDIEFDKLFEDIKEYKAYNSISQIVLQTIKQTLINTKNGNFMIIMDYLFNINRSDETCLIYSLLSSKLLRQLETKFANFTRLVPMDYYLRL